MGCCASVDATNGEERLRNNAIEDQLRLQKLSMKNEVKLLLLGAGESGKSTILKQMKLIHENGFSEDERMAYREVIFSNTVQSMQVILEAMDSLGVGLENQGNQDHVKLIMRQPAEMVTDMPYELVEAIKALWADKGVQQTVLRSNEFQLNDSATYYFECIARIGAPRYVPTDQDVLRSRVKSTGITEMQFKIGDLTYRMVDVGGQRSERKKWIHCFENVTAVIFMVALSEYDQVLFEDKNVNRMHEARMLFDSICNSRWFARTSIVLFLNKTDLFKRKLEKSPLRKYFPDYSGASNDYNAASKYLVQRFISLNTRTDKQIYTHFTCATDTEQIKFVMAAVNDIILQTNLRSVGLM